MEATKTHLLSLSSIRFRANLLYENPELLQNFDLHPEKLAIVADEIVVLVKRDYRSPNEIPPHSRWRHFEASTLPKSKIDRISPLLRKWTDAGTGKEEQVRRLLDLFVVGVLLDAGAGSKWKYTPQNEQVVYSRSEGLGIASFDLFNSGILSSNPGTKHQCDSKGLASLKVESLASAFQVSETDNPLVGLEGRCALLQRLGGVCESNPTFFKGPSGDYRPGYLLDYLLSHGTTNEKTGKVAVNIDLLWKVVMDGLAGVWPPTRTVLDGTFLGDVWPSKAMGLISNLSTAPLKDFPGSENFVCFHKLSQWLTYSLMEPLMLANIEFQGVDKMTGLAEYRNGGLFVDCGVLTLKKSVIDGLPKDMQIPRFQVWDDVVVEWRALTIALLDKTADLVRNRLGMTSNDLPLAKILEAGTWKAGREIAAKLRPDTKGPPIEVISDGTVF